jgi:tRNA(fMet)-specific endonuclease VapC
VCSVVKAVLFYGAMKNANPERNFALQQAFWDQFVSLSFDDLAATTFVTVRAQLEMRDTPIGAYDLQIDTIATHQESLLHIISRW